jgi:molybdopterin/thiamine biosynthesis adenylyltransferase
MSKRLNMDSNDTIDHDKWSRQIRTYGIEITTILSKLKILIIGLRGYGVEIAKNNYFIKSKSSIFF